MRLNKIFFGLILFLLSLGIYCSLVIGVAWDEPYTNFNALSKIEFIKSFGEDKSYLRWGEFHNPGFYEIILAFTSNLFSKFYVFEIRHLINLILSFLTLLGLYKLVKENFDRQLSLITVLFCLVNPFFFGMMSITVRDMPVCFSLVWSVYFLTKYIENYKENNLKYLILFAISVGFGLGSRIGFIINLIPLFFILIYFCIKENFRLNFKKIIFDTSIFVFISLIIVFSFWVNAYENPILVLLETIKQTKNLTMGPQTSIIGGEIYETIHTPKSYIFQFFIDRFPIFLIFLTFISIFFIFFDKDYFGKKYNLFILKFFSNFIIIFFPIFLIILLNVTLYDDLRLLIFLLPFYSLIPALGFIYLIDNFSKNFYGKLLLLISIILFGLFFDRFLKLTPYQYDYSNYFKIKFSDTKNEYQHDFWGTSYKELIKKTLKNEKFLNSNYTISNCGGDLFQIQSEFIKNEKIRKNRNVKFIKTTSASKAEYIIMINRLGNGKFKKEKCFDYFKGKDIFSVERLGVKYSVLRKIN